MMNRWYDKHENLGHNIELMKKMSPSCRNGLIDGIMVIIKSFNPTLLDDFVLDFPMDIYRHRWYDKDPYLWLTINGLCYASGKLQDAVGCYMEEERLKAENAVRIMETKAELRV